MKKKIVRIKEMMIKNKIYKMIKKYYFMMKMKVMKKKIIIKILIRIQIIDTKDIKEIIMIIEV